MSSPTAALTPNPDDPACLDGAYNLEGFTWTRPLNWFFNAASVPDKYDADAVLAVIQRGFENVTQARNDCGRPDNVAAESNYLGTTTKQPCTDRGDEFSVVGFGSMPRSVSIDTIAYTCPYLYTVYSGRQKAAAVDIAISNEVPWALSRDGCAFEELLEPVVTHEVGHAFGLDHVSEAEHPDLTMSTVINGVCENDESSLGLGDLLGLEELYPTK